MVVSVKVVALARAVPTTTGALHTPFTSVARSILNPISFAGFPRVVRALGTAWDPPR